MIYLPFSFDDGYLDMPTAAIIDPTWIEAKIFSRIRKSNMTVEPLFF